MRLDGQWGLNIYRTTVPESLSHLPKDGATLQATGFAGSTWLCAPHPAEALPAAVRELLEHHQHSATNLLPLATRRVDIRSREGTPLDGPAAIQKSEVLGFRNVAQHL